VGASLDGSPRFNLNNEAGAGNLDDLATDVAILSNENNILIAHDRRQFKIIDLNFFFGRVDIVTISPELHSIVDSVGDWLFDL